MAPKLRTSVDTACSSRIQHKTIAQLLKRLFPYIKAYKKEGLSGSICMIILSLLALPAPYLMKLIIDNVLANKNISLLNLIVLLLLGIQIAKLIFSFLTSYIFGVFGHLAGADEANG